MIRTIKLGNIYLVASSSSKNQVVRIKNQVVRSK
jgi:hypothetical protein